MKESEAPLLHMCSNHVNCGAWCQNIERRQQRGKCHNLYDLNLNKKNIKNYTNLKSMVTSSTELLYEIQRSYYSQVNGAFNIFQTMVTSKKVKFSQMLTLISCHSIIIGYHILGYLKLFSIVFSKLGI